MIVELDPYSGFGSRQLIALTPVTLVKASIVAILVAGLGIASMNHAPGNLA